MTRTPHYDSIRVIVTRIQLKHLRGMCERGPAQLVPGYAPCWAAATTLLGLPGLVLMAVIQTGDDSTVMDVVTGTPEDQARRCPGCGTTAAKIKTGSPPRREQIAAPARSSLITKTTSPALPYTALIRDNRPFQATPPLPVAA